MRRIGTWLRLKVSRCYSCTIVLCALKKTIGSFSKCWIIMLYIFQWLQRPFLLFLYIMELSILANSFTCHPDMALSFVFSVLFFLCVAKPTFYNSQANHNTVLLQPKPLPHLHETVLYRWWGDWFVSDHFHCMHLSAWVLTPPPPPVDYTRNVTAQCTNSVALAGISTCEWESHML